MTNANTIAVGQMIIIGGDIRTILAINGRWVKLDNGVNISRAAATTGREEYVEDEGILGDEIYDATELADIDDVLDVPAALETVKESKSIVSSKYLNAYTKTKIDGHRSADNGDEVAEAMRGKSVQTLVGVAILIRPEFDGRWNHLNAGQRSMNARNVIRKAFKDGTDICIIRAHLED